MPGAEAAGAYAGAYDGVAAEALARALGVPGLRAYRSAGSTMDLAHAAAGEGAAAGTVFVAEVQTAGRGRGGRPWTSEAGAGVWATVLERPADAEAVGVLSLRAGLALAERLDPHAAAPIAVKWPNDLLVGGRKLAGILVEARWREGAPEWVAVGVGVNCTPPPDLPDATGLGPAVRRRDVLAAVVAAVRSAAAATGPLSGPELARFAERDAVRGRRVVAPVAGRADGVDATGRLRVRDAAGRVHAVPTASVQYAAT